MRFTSTIAGLLSLFWVSTVSPGLRADEKGAGNSVPKEVRDMAGRYTGAWTLYGIDDKGAVTKRAAWTDTVTAEKPEVKGDRAFVSLTDEMTFEGRNEPFAMRGTEGYFLKKDGGVGDYFIETAGQIKRMVRLGENVWTYATAASAQELGQLGFPQNASGQHVLVKVVTTERGVETHRISRLTTASWKDKDGTERWLQFVSLQGFHKRQR
jgi:hypothetical protein